MDRSLLEGNPHSVLEGMLVGAYAIGSSEGYIYARNEYPLAVRNVTIAIQTLREIGLLGDNILGTGFEFDIILIYPLQGGGLPLLQLIEIQYKAPDKAPDRADNNPCRPEWLHLAPYCQ